MKVLAIALNTAREAVRNKILYSILFFACLVVGIATLLGSFSIGDQMKFAKDFGLMAVSLFGVIIAIVLGVNLLHKELTKRTILNILSKPVAKFSNPKINNGPQAVGNHCPGIGQMAKRIILPFDANSNQPEVFRMDDLASG